MKSHKSSVTLTEVEDFMTSFLLNLSSSRWRQTCSAGKCAGGDTFSNLLNHFQLISLSDRRESGLALKVSGVSSGWSTCCVTASSITCVLWCRFVCWKHHLSPNQLCLSEFWSLFQVVVCQHLSSCGPGFHLSATLFFTVFFQFPFLDIWCVADKLHDNLTHTHTHTALISPSNLESELFGADGADGVDCQVSVQALWSWTQLCHHLSCLIAASCPPSVACSFPFTLSLMLFRPCHYHFLTLSSFFEFTLFS